MKECSISPTTTSQLQSLRIKYRLSISKRDRKKQRKLRKLRKQRRRGKRRRIYQRKVGKEEKRSSILRVRESSLTMKMSRCWRMPKRSGSAVEKESSLKTTASSPSMIAKINRYKNFPKDKPQSNKNQTNRLKPSTKPLPSLTNNKPNQSETP
jgi:hypothetical protein